MPDHEGAHEASTRARPPILRGIWRYRWAVVAATLIGALLGLGLSQLLPVRYEASGQLLLTDPRDAGLFREVGPRSGDPARYVRNQAQRLQSSAVAIRTSERLDGTVEPAEVRERLTAEPSTDLDLITVTAVGPTADAAADLANTAMQAYQDVVRQEMRELADDSIAELETTQEQLQSRISEAEELLAETPGSELAGLERDAAVEQLLANQQLIERINVDVALYGAGVEMVEPAVPPERRTAPRTVANTVIAALLAFGGASAVAVWRAEVFRRADRRHEPGEILDAPLFGAVPELGEVDGTDAYPTVSAPQSPAAEAFRFAATAIERTLDMGGISTIVVTSAQPSDGKTIVALNLAVALTQENRRVLVADADTRMRGLTKLTSVPTRPGLTDLGEPAQPFAEAVHLWRPTRWLQLPVAPSGGRNLDPTAFFRSARYRSALTRLQESTDLLVIDAPPLLAVSDASAIAGSADGIVIVVRRGTPLRVLADLQERLAFVGTPVLGYIFNRASTKSGGYSYGYGYGPDRTHPPLFGVAGEYDDPDTAPARRQLPAAEAGTQEAATRQPARPPRP